METKYPPLEYVEVADRYMICLWYRRLPSPENEEQELVMSRVTDRFVELGGFTPEISKSIGW